ncbi:MAG: NfeD family protein [Verrucomicrobiaceae bacterium]|nr:NfeD family protein [Verrucomicrobiaceae bacterium]
MSPAQMWFTIGLVLVLAELALPGVVLVFIGLGAWITALTTRLGWTQSLDSQMILFAVSSLVLLVGLRRLCKTWFMGFSTSNPDTSRDLDEFAGKPVRVTAAIGPGVQGKVEFKGAAWTAEADEALAAGETAVITDIDGLCLKVRRKV